MGRFCFCALASFCFVRNDLWDCVGSGQQRERERERERDVSVGSRRVGLPASCAVLREMLLVVGSWWKGSRDVGGLCVGKP